MVNSNGEYVDDTWSVSATNAQMIPLPITPTALMTPQTVLMIVPTRLTTTITVTHQMTPMDPTTAMSLITVMTPTIQTTLNTNTYLLPVQAHHLFRKLRKNYNVVK